MLLRCVPHRDRVYGCRIRDATFGCGLPGGCCEVLEARRRRYLQEVQRLPGADEEGVRHTDG